MNTFDRRWTHAHPDYVYQIHGYPKKIVSWTKNMCLPKYKETRLLQSFMYVHDISFLILCNTYIFKDLFLRRISEETKKEFKSGYTSSLTPIHLTFQHYNTLCALLQAFGGKTILSIGTGDFSLLLEIYLDFNRNEKIILFPQLQTIKVVEVNPHKFAFIIFCIENIYSIINKTANGNFTCVKVYHPKTKKHLLPKRIMLKHIDTGRCLKVFRCALHNYAKNNVLKTTTKLELVMNWCFKVLKLFSETFFKIYIENIKGDSKSLIISIQPLSQLWKGPKKEKHKQIVKLQIAFEDQQNEIPNLLHFYTKL
ncbi:hypothetical protein RFI_35893 [Reticulomyxa filosa]|uniref:Uncharacterized protein n=1 Tax=Reticulomyxa filosa TaxID=46433 RepID=X6LIV4_RETFI|nr:hypothetical protein RFI_35893 [Reticulomyxa filosa]|eukprot:ETO01544.1 hypothetical protein RFI_35893 [Reticulomyxa filosa]